MKVTPIRNKINRMLALGFAAGFVLSVPAYAADERESLEVLRQTTLNLIDVLVTQGVMTREKADTLVRAAEQKAAATVAAQDKANPPALAEKGRIRVSYVPENVKKELREQIRQEVLAQAKTERWGEPGALPEWIDRIKWEGDIRVRSQSEMMGKSNTPASIYYQAGQMPYSTSPRNTTRAADLGSYKGDVATGNTLDDRERLRLRMRLGLTGKVSEDFTAGVRLATGSATDRVSTNQTMGQDFNKYTVLLDRAFLKFEPNDWISVSAGRIPNPWFGTDLVWDEDLNFEGIAATLGKRKGAAAFKPFVTFGAFPLREENPPTRDGRWLMGAQTGFEWNLSSRTRFKFGVAYYDYRNMEGRPESDDSFSLAGVQQNSNYGKYEYSSSMRQKGNTLFATNSINDPSDTPIWGLASKFSELNLTAALDLAHFDPVHVTLIGDYVKNLGYNKAEILRRTGIDAAYIPDGRDTGAMLKLQVGYPKIENKHDWNAYIAYRYLGSDAVLDAYTDSDFGLGGTNNKGYILGLNYGIDRNVSLGLKWLSADSMDSTIPGAAAAGYGKTKYSVDVFQVDLSAKF